MRERRLVPDLVNTLCGYCAKGDSGGCPVYPISTRYCIEFKPCVGTSHDAAVLVARGLSEAKDRADSQRRFKFMCDVIHEAI